MCPVAGPWHFSKNVDELQWPRGPLALRIEHHGSTSVVGLAAKPVIDIQVSVATLHPLHPRYITPLAVLGYVHVPHQDGAVCRTSNRKRGRTLITCIS